MAYDTGIASVPEYKAVVSAWTRQLAATLPPPSAGGCEWLMGVPLTTTIRTITGRMWKPWSIASKGSWQACSGIRPAGEFPRRGDLRLIHHR